MASKQAARHMSDSMLATNMSIKSFISEKVRPLIDRWEKEIKDMKKLMESKTKDGRRQVVIDKVLKMAEQTKQLQYDCTNAESQHNVKSSTGNKSISDHMLKMTDEWQKRCKSIKNQSEQKRQEIPNLKQELATLLSEIQWYLQYWLHNLTESENKQQQQRTFDEQHGRTNGLHPKHGFPSDLPPKTDRQQPSSQFQPVAQLTKDERQKLQDDINNLQMKYDSKVAEHLNYKRQEEAQYEAYLDNMRKEMVRQKDELQEQIMANEKVTREKDEALNRLSEIAGQKLRQNNSAIVDLSTENRPTKIAERFKELYANQWTDAFTELTENGCSDLRSIGILLSSLEDSFTFTARLSENQLEQLERSAQTLVYDGQTDQAITQTGQVNMAKTVPTNRNVSNPSGIKDQMLSRSGQTGDKKSFLKSRQAKVKSPGGKVEHAMTKFYKECAAVTWFMNVQTPPLFLAHKPAPGTPVPTDLYSMYTQSGEKVDYVVWPACLLHENGPLLTKGIVQPFKMEGKKGAKGDKKNSATNGRSETPEKGPGEKNKINQNNVNTPSGSKSSLGGSVNSTNF